jgi:hypothetical protein
MQPRTLLIVVAAVVVSACSGPSPMAPTPPVTFSTLTVTGQTTFTTLHEQGQMSATVRSTTGIMQDQTRDATWTSSRPDIANVSPTGLVTAVSSGAADITATFHGLTGAQTVGVSIACEINRTADVRFQNGKPAPISIVWNGAGLFNLEPNTTSAVVTIPAGLPQTYDFLLTNTTQRACTSLTIAFAQCSTQTITCGDPLP